MKHQGLLGHNAKMATASVIWFIIGVLVVCHAQNTDARRLNIKINRLSRKTENLENDVDDIWATILTPDKEMQDHDNKTRTDNSDTKAQDVAVMMSGTVTDVQELKTEVEQPVLSSRIGFKNEKKLATGSNQEPNKKLHRISKRCYRREHRTEKSFTGIGYESYEDRENKQ